MFWNTVIVAAFKIAPVDCDSAVFEIKWNIFIGFIDNKEYRWMIIFIITVKSFADDFNIIFVLYDCTVQVDILSGGNGQVGLDFQPSGIKKIVVIIQIIYT